MILLCDIGSSYTKIALFDGLNKEPNIVGTSYRKYLPMEYQDGFSWAKLLYDIEYVLSNRSKEIPCFTEENNPYVPMPNRTKMEAISLSSHGPSLLAIDAKGMPIINKHNPMHRTRPEVQSFRQGNSFYLPLARAMWTLFNEEQRRQIACILPPANYIAYLLTGETHVPIPEHYHMFYWTEAAVGLDREFIHLLPELFPLEKKVGDVQNIATAYKNDLIGLSPLPELEKLQGLPVFCPGVDYFAAEAGLSCCTDHLLHNHTGTSEGFNLLLPTNSPMEQTVEQPITQKQKQLAFPPGYFLNYHVINKKPILSYIQEGSGKLFDQLFQLWQQKSAKSELGYQQQNFELCPPKIYPIYPIYPNEYQYHAQNTMLQTILGDFSQWQLKQANQLAQDFMQSKTPFLEFFPKLKQETGLNDLVQTGLSVMQVLVKYFTLHCDRMFYLQQQFATEKQTQTTREVFISGGQSQHPIWLNWKAQHSNTIIHTGICDAEFIGAAAIIYYGLGYFPSVETASKKLFRIFQTYSP